jgi:hypothetical protein
MYLPDRRSGKIFVSVVSVWVRKTIYSSDDIDNNKITFQKKLRDLGYDYGAGIIHRIIWDTL